MTRPRALVRAAGTSDVKVGRFQIINTYVPTPDSDSDSRIRIRLQVSNEVGLSATSIASRARSYVRARERVSVASR